MAEASQEAVNAANAVIHQSGTEECLSGKLSNAFVRLSNSCDVSGHSSTACELASEIAGQESELSMGEMHATSETLLEVLGDQATPTDQLSLPERFRGKVDSRITSHGLTDAVVQMSVDEVKKHLEVSMAVLDAVRGEVAALMKGQRFSFVFD